MDDQLELFPVPASQAKPYFFAYEERSPKRHLRVTEDFTAHSDIEALGHATAFLVKAASGRHDFRAVRLTDADGRPVPLSPVWLRGITPVGSAD